MKLYLWVGLFLVPSLMVENCFGQGSSEDVPDNGVRRIRGAAKLDVPMYEQEGYYTCSAVCAEMIMDFLGGGHIRQCEQANQVRHSFSCCIEDGDLNEECDFPANPMFEAWGFSRRLQKTPLTWEQVTREINEGRPIASAWFETSSVAHMNVIVGYQELVPGDRKIEYLDPQFRDEPHSRIADFEDYSRFRHHSNYYMIGAESR